MGLALRSAELAAEAIIQAEHFGEGRLMRNLPKAYANLWQVRRTVCRGIAMMFSSEHVGDAVAPLVEANARIPAALLRLAGKAASSGSGAEPAKQISNSNVQHSTSNF
jgi:hypothetical protein